MMFEEKNEELSKIGKSQHLGYLKLQLKKYEDVVKKYIKSLDEEGEKKMTNTIDETLQETYYRI